MSAAFLARGADPILPSNAPETGVHLLADMAFRSVFAPEEIARERDVIFEEATKWPGLWLVGDR